jgi:hypothetical protein
MQISLFSVFQAQKTPANHITMLMVKPTRENYTSLQIQEPTRENFLGFQPSKICTKSV